MFHWTTVTAIISKSKTVGTENNNMEYPASQNFSQGALTTLPRNHKSFKNIKRTTGFYGFSLGQHSCLHNMNETVKNMIHGGRNKAEDTFNQVKHWNTSAHIWDWSFPLYFVDRANLCKSSILFFVCLTSIHAGRYGVTNAQHPLCRHALAKILEHLHG